MENIRKHLMVDTKPTRATLVDIKNVFESQTHKVKMVKKAEVLAPITEDVLTDEMQYLAFRVDGDSSVEKQINKLWVEMEESKQQIKRLKAENHESKQRIKRLEEVNHELEAIKLALYMHDSVLYLNSRLSFLLHEELLSSTSLQTWFGEGRPFKNIEEDIDFGHVLFHLNKSGMIAFPEIRCVLLRCCNKLIAEYHDAEGHTNSHVTGEWFLNTFAEVRFMGKPFRTHEGHKFCVFFEPPHALNQPLVLCKNLEPKDPLRVYTILVAAKDTKRMIECNFNEFSYVFQLKEGITAEDQYDALQTVLHVAFVMIIKDVESWILQQGESFVKSIETYKNADLLCAPNKPLLVSSTTKKLNCPRLGGIPIIRFDEGQCYVPLTTNLSATSGNYQPVIGQEAAQNEPPTTRNYQPVIWGYGQEAAQNEPPISGNYQPVI